MSESSDQRIDKSISRRKEIAAHLEAHGLGYEADSIVHELYWLGFRHGVEAMPNHLGK